MNNLTKDEKCGTFKVGDIVVLKILPQCHAKVLKVYAAHAKVQFQQDGKEIYKYAFSSLRAVSKLEQALK